MTKEELADQQIMFRVRTFIYVLVSVFVFGVSAGGVAWNLSTLRSEMASMKAQVATLVSQVASIQQRLGIDDYRSGEREVAQHEPRH